MLESLNYSQTTQDPVSENKRGLKRQNQIFFLICESCYWCASALSLRPTRNETTPKCPICDGDGISIIPISRGHQLDNAIKKNCNSDHRSVLIVDDNHDIVRILERDFREYGFKVSAFTDPTTALESLNPNDDGCNLVISDIRMPGMNGYELIRKAKEIKKQLKVVLMSAFEIEDGELHNLLPDISVDGFIQKPFPMMKLNDLIGKINAR
jgi:CheY-like chemotaxis protein